MTFMPANGCFIDYGSGGSLTMRVLILIRNADPSTIMGYANNITRVLQTLESLRGDLAQVPNRQLPEAWPTGAASQAARQRLTWLFSTDCFGSINKGAGDFAGELGGAAGQLQKAQQIYNKTVAVMNGVVGALLSNPWTHGAGVALAHSVVNIIDGFMKIVARILDALHVAKLIKLVHDIMKVVEAVKQIIDAFHGGSHVPALPGASTTLPAISPTFPSNGNGSTSSGWVPVNPGDPGTSPAGGFNGTGGSSGVTAGAPGTTGGATGTTATGGLSGPAGGETITIEVSKDGLKVLAPGGLHQDFNVHVDATVDGERVSGDVNIDV